jgi:hypothetical protein
MMQACHDYLTRAAQTEASRVPNGEALLAEQLDALNKLHAWLFAKLHGFQRRFEQARASLLASLDSSAIKAFVEDVVYQGPLHAEVPFGKFGVRQSDGSLAFALAVPATLANKRSVVRDMLRVLLGNVAGADKGYLQRSGRLRRGSGGGHAKGLRGFSGPQGNGAAHREDEIVRQAATALHPLLEDGPDIVAQRGESIPLGTVQVRES